MQWVRTMSEHELDKNTNLDNITLALLFASDEPLSIRRMAAILDDVPAAEIRQSVESWRKRFDDDAWSISIEKVAGGYRMSTRSDYAPFVGRLYSRRRKLRLSRAGLETLAIIAYKQPVTRAEVETVRGVGSGSVIANLMERSLVKITGKAKVLGAPFLYATTPEFLEYLGLNSLKDLPSLEELEALLEKEAYPETATEGDAAAADHDADGADDEPLADDEAESSPDDRATAPSSARVGPGLEEPVNRPLGGEERAGGGPQTHADADSEDAVDERVD